MPSSHTLAPGADVVHSPKENDSRAQERLGMDVDISSSTTSLADIKSKKEGLASINMFSEERTRGGIAATRPFGWVKLPLKIPFYEVVGEEGKCRLVYLDQCNVYVSRRVLID